MCELSGPSGRVRVDLDAAFELEEYDAVLLAVGATVARDMQSVAWMA